MNSLADWLKHLESLHPKGQDGIELGLTRVARVKAALQQRPWCPLIVVGGTNGKGSTCATLEAIYGAAGYRVGCYSSPHLLDYNERIRVDNVPVDDAALCAAFARVEAARREAGEVALTYFEFGTLAAWEVFAAREVDVLILEVGLGGRLDAVNVYDADCAVVTGVALDHTDWLGWRSGSVVVYGGHYVFSVAVPVTGYLTDPEKRFSFGMGTINGTGEPTPSASTTLPEITGAETEPLLERYHPICAVPPTVLFR